MRMSQNKLNILDLLKNEPNVSTGVLEERLGMLRSPLNRLLKQMTEQGLITRDMFTLTGSEALENYGAPTYRTYRYSLLNHNYSDYYFGKAVSKIENSGLSEGRDYRNPTDVTASLQTLNELSGQVSIENQKLLEAHVESLTRYLKNDWITTAINSTEPKVLRAAINRMTSIGSLDKEIAVINRRLLVIKKEGILGLMNRRW